MTMGRRASHVVTLSVVFALSALALLSAACGQTAKQDPVVEGARITVECIREELGADRTIERLLEAHPRLTRDGVLAAVRFGAEVLRADLAYPVSKSVA